MNSKHTPGPWMAEEVKTSIGRAFRINDKPGQDFDNVATIYDSHTWDNKKGPVQHEANARLIASAPELLVALEELLAAAEEDGGELNDPIEKAKAAISKAKGVA